MGRLSDTRRWSACWMPSRQRSMLCYNSLHCHQLMFLTTLRRDRLTQSRWFVRLPPRFWMPSPTSTGAVRSISTRSQPISWCVLTVSTSGTQIKGTYNFDYAAPEILEEAKAFPQSDVWSLGVLLYVLMSGQLPFKGETPEETKDNILRVQFKFEWLYKECTMEGTRLLMWIFKRKPHARPSLEEVSAHRWTNPADYMLKKRERARFPTNRIQKFCKDYHKSKPAMDMDSQSFMARLLQ